MVVVTALVLGIVTGVVVNEQVEPVGNPDEQESEMLLGYVGRGVSVIVKLAGWPAVTVALAGAVAMLKSVTGTDGEGLEQSCDPPLTVMHPVFESEVATDGVSTSVTVAVEPT